MSSSSQQQTRVQEDPGSVAVDQEDDELLPQPATEAAAAARSRQERAAGARRLSGHQRLQQLIPQRPRPRAQQMPARILTWGAGSPVAPLLAAAEDALIGAPGHAAQAAAPAAAASGSFQTPLSSKPLPISRQGSGRYGSSAGSRHSGSTGSSGGSRHGGAGRGAGIAALIAADTGITSSFKHALLESICSSRHEAGSEGDSDNDAEQQERGPRPPRRSGRVMTSYSAWQVQQQQQQAEQQQGVISNVWRSRSLARPLGLHLAGAAWHLPCRVIQQQQQCRHLWQQQQLKQAASQPDTQQAPGSQTAVRLLERAAFR
ncbi:hypothetical protein COO60DRAFT_603106 [Scenedesmus sp. NREL 46B-D3]|nr:hypothetical protein COO60DRAFT_603106 [Scenedesmus sp. NREL 46B-D3]